MGNLAGRGFLVIGGTEGVGKEMALLASRQGATVLFGRPPGSLTGEGPGASTRSEYPEDRICTAEIDLSSPSEVDRLFDLAADRLPGLHLLVMDLTAHASLLCDQLLHETSLSDWNEGLSIHLRQPFVIAQRALEEFLIAREGGRIVFVLQSASSPDTPEHASIAAAQSALASFVRSLAKEYGRRNVVCNAVMLRDGGGAPRCHEAAAETVLFLASDEASFVNGEILEVTP